MAIINVTTTVDENNGTGAISLREAVIQANGSAGDDTIVLGANQTYTLTRKGFGENASATGDLDILSGGGKLTILVSSVSGSIGTATINGGGIDRIFDLNSGANLTLENLTIKGGKPVRFFDDGSTSVGNGGGISIYRGGQLNLINAVITGNNAANGSGITNWYGSINIANSTINFNTTNDYGSAGGIWNAFGIMNIVNSTISSNSSDSQGGGVHNLGTMNITNSNISSNSATGAGGVHNGGIMNIANSTISSNFVSQGGGGVVNQGTMNITNSTINSHNVEHASGILNEKIMNIDNSTITSNSAENNAGGIQNDGTMNIANSTISSNFAGFGGGVFNRSGTMNITNSTISSNSASSGGGIASLGNMNVANSTITGNTASIKGSGLLSRYDNTVSISNSIIAQNYRNKDINIDTLTSAISEGYNLIGNATGVTQVFNKTGDMIGTATNPLNAKLGPLQNNGGLTKTHALLTGSPAINKGKTTLTKDQRGYNRNGVADIGAYEYWETAYPTTGADKIIGTAGADIIDGLAGNDTISGLGSNDRLLGSVGDDSINGGAGDDSLLGNSGNDTLIASAGNDLLNGGDGADRLDGSAGTDTLIGAGGNDLFLVNPGNDRLTGGTGADRFTYNTNATFSKTAVGVDTITDFVISQNDKIVLDKTTFPKITSANGTGFSRDVEFAKVTTDTVAAISSADIVYNTATGALFYNQNGTATGFGTGGKFAILSNKPGLTENQFIIQP